MITGAILKFLGAVMSGALGLFPSLSVPEWWLGVVDFVSDASGSLDAFANYLPVAALRYSAVFLLLCYSVALGVRVVRMVISAFTGGGGS